MNQIEIWNGIFTRKLIRCGTFSSVKALNKAIESFVAHWNSDCGPIAWTATEEEILDKVRTVTSRMGATDVSVGGFHDHDLVRSRCVDLRIRPVCDHLSRSAGVCGGAARCGGQAPALHNAARRGRGGSQVQGGACAIA